MARTVTITCDRCKKVIPEADTDQVWRVGFICTNANHAALYSTSIQYPHKSEEWCRACCEVLHILPISVLSREAIPAKPPTLEELIRELVREEMTNG